MKCNICSNNSNEIFETLFLNKYNVKYYHCPVCGHLQTEHPYWSDEAYVEAISAEDTGILKRNYDNRIITSAIIEAFFNNQSKFLDYAGGWGILTRLMRDEGYDFVWTDKYAKNLFARGFEYKNADKIELITAFEVFEHLANPVEELKRMFEISNNILFSQPILPDPVPRPDMWWYYAPQAGQHISFYSRTTLLYLAEKFQKNYVGFNDYQLFSDKKISQEDFETIIKNSYYIYLKKSPERKSKTAEDMDYIKSLQI